MSARIAGPKAGVGSPLLFTSPWDTVFIKKGDALGLKPLASQFSNAVAPDFSNRIRDGRWVTILAWCLSRSHRVFRDSDGSDVDTYSEQIACYAWVRPLELMWVARTITCTADHGKKRSLAGKNSVTPWCKGKKKSADHFGMSEDQFRAYRQSGMYGRYRRAFRRWPGMTRGADGWTPDKATESLAKWLDTKLGTACPDLSNKSARASRGHEDQWWLKKWGKFDYKVRGIEATLPRRSDDFGILPESRLLRPIIFGKDQSGEKRFEVATAAAKCSGLKHIDICDQLARTFDSDPIIKHLPRFSRLADAGMELMDLVAEAVHGKSEATLAHVAARPDSSAKCKALTKAAKDWLAHSGEMSHIPHIETANRFARAISSSGTAECVRKLLEYHEHEIHGGLRWFVVRGNKIEQRTGSVGSSRYRFCLWPLCRLATQCGVLNAMPRALRTNSEASRDELEEETDE